MKEKMKKKLRPHVLSRYPYRRRKEPEMVNIVKEIQSVLIGIRAAFRKHGICPPTLQKWITRLSVRNLGDELSLQLLSRMTEEQKSNAIEVLSYSSRISSIWILLCLDVICLSLADPLISCFR